jgi:hypothetical protein
VTDGNDCAWRIDTLDPRGGLAFASWRESFDAEETPADREPPCVFIGAPHFRPEPVANRALAQAAGRGAFQMGLYTSEHVEAAFPTPEAVAEFVRRAYLSGGSGDEPEGDDGAGALRPNDWPNPPQVPGLDGDTPGLRFREDILKAIGRFGGLSLECAQGEAKAFDEWPVSAARASKRAKGARLHDGADLLASAALHLMAEMLSRLPHASNARELALWQGDARLLGLLICRLGIWPLIASPRHFGALHKLIDFAARHKNGYGFLDQVKAKPEPVFLIAAAWLLFVECIPLDSADTPNHFFDFPYRRGTSVFDEHVDPVAALKRIPLPRDVHEFLPEREKKGTASLFHALAAFLGSPARAQEHPALVDLMLFAAAAIAVHDGGRLMANGADFWLLLSGRSGASGSMRMVAQMHAQAGWEWLAGQLPDFAFPEELERAIGQAGGLQLQAQLQQAAQAPA